MKYKAEVHFRSKIQKEFFFNNLSHPNQVMRNVVESVRSRFTGFVVLIVNDEGDLWKYSVMKKPDGKFYVRRMAKGNVVFTRDDLDMIFTGNKSIVW